MADSSRLATPRGHAQHEHVSRRLATILPPLVLAALVVAPFGYLSSNGQAFWTAVAGAWIGTVSFLLNRRGYVDSAVLLLVVAMLVAVTLSMVAGEGVHDSGMVLYPTVLVIGGMLLRPAAYTALVALTIVSVAVVYALGEAGHIAPRFRTLTDPTDFVAIATVLVVQAIALGLLSRGLYRGLREAHRESEERREAERQVRELNAELETRVAHRTAELEAANRELEAYSWSVSHDLRTPLRVVGGYVRMLEEDYAKEWSPGAKQILHRIRVSSSRMSRLVEQLLEFSRVERQSIERTVVDMDQIVAAVVETVREDDAERQIEWIVDPLPPAWGDAVLLAQVWQNLLSNAVKYTKQRDVARIHVGFVAGGSEPGYFVRDNGAGFDMEYAGKLFGMFERLHAEDEFEGNGVGLASVQRIVARHGGSVHAKAAKDAGATFRFVLPPPPGNVVREARAVAGQNSQPRRLGASSASQPVSCDS